MRTLTWRGHSPTLFTDPTGRSAVDAVGCPGCGGTCGGPQAVGDFWSDLGTSAANFFGQTAGAALSQITSNSIPTAPAVPGTADYGYSNQASLYTTYNPASPGTPYVVNPYLPSNTPGNVYTPTATTPYPAGYVPPSTPISSTTWLLVGGGVLAVALVAILASKKG